MSFDGNVGDIGLLSLGQLLRWSRDTDGTTVEETIHNIIDRRVLAGVHNDVSICFDDGTSRDGGSKACSGPMAMGVFVRTNVWGTQPLAKRSVFAVFEKSTHICTALLQISRELYDLATLHDALRRKMNLTRVVTTDVFTYGLTDNR